MLNFKSMYQKEYNAIAIKDPHTFYIVKPDPESDPVIISMSVQTPPNKTQYRKGETLDLTGLTLRLEYDHPTSTQVDAEVISYIYCDVSIPQGTVINEATPRELQIWWPPEGAVDPYEGHMFTTSWFYEYLE